MTFVPMLRNKKKEGWQKERSLIQEPISKLQIDDIKLSISKEKEAGEV